MLTVASIFAGCGGSSLGYRAAGLDVRYACDSDSLARRAYRLNAAPGTVAELLDVRSPDTADRVLAACGGPPDVLDASPPCGQFTHNGPRNPDSAEAKLYGETARLVAKIRPRAAVIENVTGVRTGVMERAHFLPAIRTMEEAGYRVAWDTLNASRHGVPQIRRRVIVIALRGDVRADPTGRVPRA